MTDECTKEDFDRLLTCGKHKATVKMLSLHLAQLSHTPC